MTDPWRIQVLISRLDPGLPLPGYAHPGDAGADLHAREDVTLAPGQRALVPTGVAIALPAGYAGFVHPRSGLAARHGITVLNAPGTVDAGYRGEILVNLINTDPCQAFAITRGDRIAQLVVQPVSEAHFVEVRSLPGSQRGDNGHGASGGFGTQNPSATTSGTSAAVISAGAAPAAAAPAAGTSTAATSTAVTSTAMTPTTKD
jgi:dUTP pyrophosphatase